MMATKAEIINVLKELRSAYPGYRPADPEAVIETYTRHLSTLPVGALNEAAVRCVREVKFFPSVAELLSAAKGYEPEAAPQEPFDALWTPYLSMNRFRGEQMLLEAEFYQTGRLDENAWMDLIKDLSRNGLEEARRTAELKYQTFTELL
jgi:hypothetical protein